MGKNLNRHFSKQDIQMANKHMKWCSGLYVIREMQIKTTVTNFYAATRMAKIQNTENPKCWQGCGAIGIHIHCWWECKTVQPLWKGVWRFLTKLNILLPYDPAIALLVFTQMSWKLMSTQKFVHECLQQVNSELPILGSNWDVLQ